MNLKQLLATCFMTSLFASCAHIYEPALYHQDIAYQPKPSSFDSVKSANYISGSYSIYANSNLNDQVESGQLNLSQAYIFNHFNIAYGAFGAFGDYENYAINPGQPNYFKDKPFGAFGARASANLFKNADGVDYRYLGFEAAYSHEFGPFASFRKYLNTQNVYYVNPGTDLFTIGLTTEILIQSPKHKKKPARFSSFCGNYAWLQRFN